MMLGTPRARRARNFANMAMAIMRDFLPPDRECSRRIVDHLQEVGYYANLQIINVPPEWDALDKLAIEQAMFKTHPAFIPVESGSLLPKT